MLEKLKVNFSNLKTSWNNLSRLKKILFISVLVVILVQIFLLTFFNSNQTSAPIPQDNNSTVQNAPDVKFNLYSINKPPVLNPQDHYLYTLKSNFTDEQIQNIARNLGINSELESDSDNKVLAFSPDNGVFEFDRITGEFKAISFSPAPATSQFPEVSAIDLLNDLGLYDPTIDCSITYKRYDTPHTTFVECHRTWELMSAPLVTLPGVLNTYDFNVDNIRVGYVGQAGLDDPEVYDISTGENGKARPIDFNSVTIGIKNNEIVSIDSNMRWVESVSPVTSEEIISYSEAINSLASGNTRLSLVIPEGQYSEWNDVFPDNQAFAQNANVTSINLIYLESLGGEKQITYEPMYLVYGTAKIESGHSVKFVQAVSALKNPNVLGEQALAQAGFDEQRESLQIRDFIPESPTPTIPSENPPEKIVEEADCRFGTQRLTGKPWIEETFSLDIPGYGRMDVLRRNRSGTLFVKSTEASDSSISAARNAIFQALEDQYIFNYANREDKSLRLKDYGNLVNLYEQAFGQNPDTPGFGVNFFFLPRYAYAKGLGHDRHDRLVENFERRAIEIDEGRPGIIREAGFPLDHDISLFMLWDGNSEKWKGCYLTGGSPFIFLYTDKKTDVSINPSHVVYKNPDSDWSFSLNGSTSLYYEFDKSKVKLAGTDYGYSFEYSKTENALESIARDLGLNSEETRAFKIEIENSLQSLNPEYLSLRLVSEEELNEKLPLKVSPKPDNSTRIHFLIETEKLDLKVPDLEKIKRSGFSLVEIGASR